MFGPGTRAELPPNFSSYEWKVREPADQVRRSIYLFAKRNLPYPMMAAFDFPDMHESCGCRSKTTIAPQALMLLNDRVILNAARQLANRATLAADSADPAAQVQTVWRIAFGRPAADRETQQALTFLAEQQQIIANSLQDQATENKTSVNAVQEAFVDLCHSLLNANEFLFVE